MNKEAPLLRTKAQEQRDKRNLAIYNDWKKLIAVKGQSRTAVASFLMDKYNIGTLSTIYVITRKVAESLAEKEEEL